MSKTDRLMASPALVNRAGLFRNVHWLGLLAGGGEGKVDFFFSLWSAAF